MNALANHEQLAKAEHARLRKKLNLQGHALDAPTMARIIDNIRQPPEYQPMKNNGFHYDVAQHFIREHLLDEITREITLKPPHAALVGVVIGRKGYKPSNKEYLKRASAAFKLADLPQADPIHQKLKDSLAKLSQAIATVHSYRAILTGDPQGSDSLERDPLADAFANPPTALPTLLGENFRKAGDNYLKMAERQKRQDTSR